MSDSPRESDTQADTEANTEAHADTATPQPDAGSPEAASSKRAKPSGRRRWTIRLAITAVVLLAIYTIVGVFVVPVVVQRAVVPRIAEALTGDVAVEGVSCNPFTLGLELRGITVTEGSGEEAVRVARIAGNFNLIETVFNDGFWFNHLRVFEPVVRAEIDEQGRINLLELLGELPEPEDEPGEPPRVVIGGVAIESATIRFRDRTTSPAFERTIRDLTLRCDRLDTAPTHANPLDMTATLGEATSVRWDAQAALDPLDATGVLRVEGLQLDAFSPYAETFAGLSIDRGEVDVELRYMVDLPTATGGVAIERSGLKVRDVAISAGEHPVLRLAEVDITGIAASLFDGEASVERIAVTGLEADARREADGQLEVLRRYLEAIRTASFHGEPADAASPGEAGDRLRGVPQRHPVEVLVLAVYDAFADRELDWRLTLGELEVRESALRWRDLAAAEPVDVALADISFDMGTLTNRAGSRTPLRLSLTGPEGGRLEAEGEVALMDREAELEVNLAGWPLAPLRGYLPSDWPEPFAGTRLVSALADARGMFEGSRGEDGFDLAWNGRAGLRDVVTRRPKGEPPLAFDELAATGGLEVVGRLPEITLDATWDGTLDVSGFDARVAMPEAAGRLAFASLSVDGGAEAGYAKGAFTATWEGAVSLADLDADTSAPLAGGVTAAEVALAGGRVTWEGDEPAIEIASIAADEPLLRLVLPMLTDAVPVEVEISAVDAQESREKPDSQNDRETRENAEAGGTDASPAETLESMLAGLPFELRLDSLTFTNASFEVSDQPGEGGLMLTGREGEATLESIDTTGQRPMSIAASASVLDAGRAEVTGEANLFGETMSVDLVATVRDLPVRPLSPGLSPQLGYAVDRGRLNLDLPVRVTGTELSGKIEAKLQGFYLGEKVDSPAAPNLPLKLGLDLLRNRNDVVSLNIGLTGNIADPSFRLSKLIWGSIFKAVGSVASSPFRLIASVVGGSDELDLSRARFEPGRTQLAEGETRVIDLLVEGLQKRPRLNLLVIGVTGPEDAAALRRMSLRDTLAARAEAEGISPERAMRERFEERFPDAAQQRVPVPPGRLDQATIAPDAMRARLMENVELADDALTELSRNRAERVVAMLTGMGVDGARLTAAAGGKTEAGVEREAAPAVMFDLLSRSSAE